MIEAIILDDDLIEAVVSEDNGLIEAIVEEQ